MDPTSGNGTVNLASVYKILVLANGIFLKGFINILENGLLGNLTKVTLASTRQEARSLLINKGDRNAVVMDFDFDRMPIFDLISNQ